MRVLLLNQVFYPDKAATAQHAWDLALHLTAQGHEVHAIAHRSLYGQKGADMAAYEVVQGVHIHRVGRNLFSKGGLLSRAIDFAGFYAAAMLKLVRVPKPDVVVSFTTPPFIAAAGHVMARLRGGKSVYWLMDMYPDVPVALGMFKRDAIWVKAFEKLNRWTLKHSDRVVVLGRCMMDRVREKGISGAHVQHIGVWSAQDDTEDIQHDGNPYREQWGLGDRFVVMYSGNFGLGHDVQTFLEAAKQLKEDDRIRFVFVGGGKKKPVVDAFIQEHTLSNCVIADYQPREKLGQSLGCADVHLVSVLEGMEGLIVPCKLFGVMAATRPAIYIGDPSSEIARVLHEHDAGKVVKQGDVDGMVRTITALAEKREEAAQLGKNAATALTTVYDRTAACEQWRVLLEDVVGEKA